MAPPSHIHLIEGFNLALLRALETQLDRAKFVVKGGMNLRAWFGSPRYSEDLDLDTTRIEPHALRDVVDRTITSPGFTSLLRQQAMSLTRVSRPKQTDMTQRWKFEICATSSARPIHTKLDVSRRGVHGSFVAESALQAVVLPHGVPPPTVNHYTARQAIIQKIHALATRKEPRARDVWDLEYLFRTTQVDPRPIPEDHVELVPIATERVLTFSFEDFMDQVFPFLAPDVRELFESPEAWEAIRELVLDRLLEVSR
jgi:predicted nucleotidyltransferase component of viral defense system